MGTANFGVISKVDDSTTGVKDELSKNWKWN